MKAKILCFALLFLIPGFCFASELFENYNTGDDDADGISGSSWRGQTFLTTDSHNIDYIQLDIYRSGTPGIVTAYIYAVADDIPTGDSLCSGTINGDTLPESAEMVQINLTSCPVLENATEYAIVLTAQANYVFWRFDSSTGYAEGNYIYSSDAGENWNTNGNNDFMFEIYGTTGESATTATSSVADFQANSIFFAFGFLIFFTAFFGSIQWITHWS